MTNAEIIAAVRGIIDDPDQAFCSDAELQLHLDEVAMDFARESRVMRNTQVVNILAGQAVLNLPEACTEIIRVVRSDGLDLGMTSSLDLAGAKPTWINDSGTPTDYLQDLTGNDQVWLYPNPSLDDTLTITYFQGHVIGLPIEIPSRHHITLVWGTGAKALAKSTNEADQPKIQQFSQAYASGVKTALQDASGNFTTRARGLDYPTY